MKVARDTSDKRTEEYRNKLRNQLNDREEKIKVMEVNLQYIKIG